MHLHPFFSFFGSKYRLTPHYPTPIYNKIIEPFAGSAGYSLYYPERNIHLYDIDQTIVNLWKWLINVKEKTILKLPDLSRGTTVDNLNICLEAKWLIGFWTTESQTYPSRYHLSPCRHGSWNERKRKLIASQLKYIRHWKVDQSDYQSIRNRTATWFIDPPYTLSGKRYKHSKIDFSNLAEWSLNRKGQIIVCEQSGAKWLSFRPLRTWRNASNNIYKEVIFIK